jgi:hypothetical protein
MFPNSTIAYNSEEPFSRHTPDLVFPFFAIIELTCFAGWVKVALSLLNPFGGKRFIDFNKIYDVQLQ